MYAQLGGQRANEQQRSSPGTYPINAKGPHAGA